MLVKFEKKNRMVQTAQNFKLFDEKNRVFENYFGQSFDALLEDFFVAETIV